MITNSQLYKDLIEIFEAIGFDNTQAQKLTENLVTEVYDKTYFEILDEDNKAILQKAIDENNSDLANEINNRIDQKRFKILIEKHTQDSLGTILQDIHKRLSSTDQESFMQLLQGVKNKNLLKNLDNSSPHNTLKALLNS